jgi:Dolichyl-phosphate-mannose-protein mannosyltransferase
MPNRQSPKTPLVAVAIIAVAFIFTVDSTWMTWPDAIYDFGSQLYYPWQMAAGKHLYTDIAYFNGPLSQYFNASMFALFGPSLHTLIWVNLAIVAGMLLMIYRLMNRLGDALTATFACAMFITLFAFSQYVGIGNYNWICPYTHEVTHGVALSMAMIIAMGALLQTNHPRWNIISGALLGLIFLTKAEVFVPAVGAALVGLLLWGRAISFVKLSKQIPLFFASFAIVILIAFTFIAITISPSTATRAIMGSWPWIFDRRISQLQFYRQGLGIDDPAGNLWKMLLIGAATLAILGTLIATGLRRIAIIFVFAELIAVAWYWQWTTQIARPWPVLVAIIGVISIARAWRKDHPNHLQWSTRSMLCIFAFGLLGKMLLNARIWQYGFALALPAALVLIDAILGWIPREISLRGGNGPFMRWAAAAMLVCITLCVYANQHRVDGTIVGSAGDQFISYRRGDEVNQAAKTIEYLIPKSGTLAVMPQGLMLNYLTRRADSISTVNLMPPEVLSVGEENVVAELNAHPPDLIVLSEKDIQDESFVLTEGEYHYGHKILAWVLSHYHQTNPSNSNSELKLSFWKRTQKLN